MTESRAERKQRTRRAILDAALRLWRGPAYADYAAEPWAEAEIARLTAEQASLAKYTSTRTARSIAANARDLLGGNGILIRHEVGRHFADIEALHTYEGTETVQALIIGRDLTGVSAFA